MSHNCPYCNNELIISFDAKIQLKKKEIAMLNIDGNKPKEFNGFSPLIDFDDSKGITNFNDRKGTKIDKIVIHSTGEEKAGRSSVVNWFSNKSSQVSAHYLVTSDGKICGLVHEDKRAWHATTANSSSIGIENQGPCGLKQLKPEQLKALVRLILDIRSRYGNIPILTHADIDPIRKSDDPFKPEYKKQSIAEIESKIKELLNDNLLSK